MLLSAAEKLRELLPEVYKRRGCQLMRTLKELNIQKNTYYNWIHRYPEFKEAMAIADMELAEDVEAILLDKIFKERSSADVHFYLKRKGKCIGYDNSVDFVVKNEAGESVSIDDLEKLIKELKEHSSEIKNKAFDVTDLSK